MSNPSYNPRRFEQIRSPSQDYAQFREKAQKRFLDMLLGASENGTYFDMQQGIQELGRNIKERMSGGQKPVYVFITGAYGTGKTYSSKALGEGARDAGLDVLLYDNDGNFSDFLGGLKKDTINFSKSDLVIVGQINAARVVKEIGKLNPSKYLCISLVADQTTRHGNSYVQSGGMVNEWLIRENEDTRAIHNNPNLIDEGSNYVIDTSNEHRITAEQIRFMFQRILSQ